MDALAERLIRVSGDGVRREHGELRPGEARPVKTDYRVVEKWMTSGEAFRAVCAVCVQHIEGNRSGALAAADPEYLHQMRVALRRLRTAFEVFADGVPQPVAAPLLEELRWLSRALGRARDWDVFIAGALRPALAQRSRRSGLRALRDASEDLSADARSSAQRALESRRYYALMRALRALGYGDTPLAPRPAGAVRSLPMRHAVAVIAAMVGRARKRGRKLKRLDSRELHRLRKAVRRLRYGLLFLAPLLPEARVRPLAESVESLQETLGGINDCAVAGKLVEQARGRVRGSRLRKARKLLRKRIAAALGARRAALGTHWEEFRAAHKAWPARAGGGRT
jgi:CHAD domain-containing protein